MIYVQVAVFGCVATVAGVLLWRASRRKPEENGVDAILRRHNWNRRAPDRSDGASVGSEGDLVQLGDPLRIAIENEMPKQSVGGQGVDNRCFFADAGRKFDAIDEEIRELEKMDHVCTGERGRRMDDLARSLGTGPIEDSQVMFSRIADENARLRALMIDQLLLRHLSLSRHTKRWALFTSLQFMDYDDQTKSVAAAMRISDLLSRFHDAEDVLPGVKMVFPTMLAELMCNNAKNDVAFKLAASLEAATRPPIYTIIQETDASVRASLRLYARLFGRENLELVSSMVERAVDQLNTVLHEGQVNRAEMQAGVLCICCILSENIASDSKVELCSLAKKHLGLELWM